MNDAVAIALKGIAVGMRRFGMATSAGVFYVDGIVSELGVRSQCEYPGASLPRRFKDCWRGRQTKRQALH